ncbi:MAG: GFA family protein [Proteobacteria bacterium]|nr:GFA family protein [Pseudomonadota bacterium]
MVLDLPLSGGCICGALRYRVNGLPLAVFICHCRNCKQRTGSAFSLSMITQRKDFEQIEGGTIWRDWPGGSGNMHRQHLCPHCLTRTHTEMLAYPDIVNVRPGTLDRPDAVVPIAQAWTSAAHAWAIAPDIKRFEEDPSDVQGLFKEWRAIHR